jgi:hypothetical protein
MISAGSTLLVGPRSDAGFQSSKPEIFHARRRHGYECNSRLASLAVIWLGARIAYWGTLGFEHGDYSGIVLGIALAAAYVIIPAICAAASARLAERKPWASIVVASMRLMPIAIAVLAIGLRFPA